jgi:catechol 2,3-dioxygenase-like lactoylglutathione lyase family enzyme
VATGIGGVFFKAKDAKKLRGWYEQHLGMVASSYGLVDMRWRELAEPFRVAHTIWATFKPESTHFDGPFMINYRVDELDALLKKLEKDGVKIERGPSRPTLASTGHRTAHRSVRARVDRRDGAPFARALERGHPWHGARRARLGPRPADRAPSLVVRSERRASRTFDRGVRSARDVADPPVRPGS